MSTGHVNHLLSDYLEGSIAKVNADKIKSHLVFCNNCRHTLNDFEKNRQRLGELPAIAMPADLEEKILTKLKSQSAAASAAEAAVPSEPINWGPLLIIGGALSAIVLIVLFVKNIPDRAPEAPAMETTVAEAPRAVEAAPAVEAPVQPPAPPVVENPPVAPAPVQPKAPDPLAAAPAAPALPGDALVDINGGFSGIDQAQETVLKNEKGWKNFWKNHVKNVEPAPPLPAVNFETHDIIAVFSGSQSSGGYSVEITKIEETTWEGAPARIVHYRTAEPPSGAMNTMALTQPHHIKTTPKIAGRTFFRKNR